jgi:hypothetical protein
VLRALTPKCQIAQISEFRDWKGSCGGGGGGFITHTILLRGETKDGTVGVQAEIQTGHIPYTSERPIPVRMPETLMASDDNSELEKATGLICKDCKTNKKQTPWPLVHERTIPKEQDCKTV